MYITEKQAVTGRAWLKRITHELDLLFNARVRLGSKKELRGDILMDYGLSDFSKFNPESPVDQNKFSKMVKKSIEKHIMILKDFEIEVVRTSKVKNSFNYLIKIKDAQKNQYTIDSSFMPRQCLFNVREIWRHESAHELLSERT